MFLTSWIQSLTWSYAAGVCVSGRLTLSTLPIELWVCPMFSSSTDEGPTKTKSNRVGRMFKWACERVDVSMCVHMRASALMSAFTFECMHMYVYGIFFNELCGSDYGLNGATLLILTLIFQTVVPAHFSRQQQCSKTNHETTSSQWQTKRKKYRLFICSKSSSASFHLDCFQRQKASAWF